MHITPTTMTGMTLFGKSTSAGEVAVWIGVLFSLHVAYAREVLLQVRVQSRLYASLPPRIRRAFPDRPASPRTVAFGSLAFVRSYFGYIFTDTSDDSPEIAALKIELRASDRRERWFATLAMASLLACAIAFWRK